MVGQRTQTNEARRTRCEAKLQRRDARLIDSGFFVLFLIVIIPSVESFGMIFTSMSPDDIPSNMPIEVVGSVLAVGPAAIRASGPAMSNATMVQKRGRDFMRATSIGPAPSAMCPSVGASLGDLLVDLAHRTAGADQVRKVVALLELLAKMSVLVDQPLFVVLDQTVHTDRV